MDDPTCPIRRASSTFCTAFYCNGYQRKFRPVLTSLRFSSLNRCIIIDCLGFWQHLTGEGESNSSTCQSDNRQQKNDCLVIISFYRYICFLDTVLQLGKATSIMPPSRCTRNQKHQFLHIPPFLNDTSYTET